MPTKSRTTARNAAKSSSKASSRKTAPRASAKRAPAKARKPAGPTLRQVAPSVTVNDVTASLAWYCDVLGFTIKERWENQGVLLGAELVSGDARLFVGQDDWKKGRDRAKGEGVRLYLSVPSKKDVDRFAAAIRSRGGTLASELRNDFGTRAFDLVDPTGFKITVMA